MDTEVGVVLLAGFPSTMTSAPGGVLFSVSVAVVLAGFAGLCSITAAFGAAVALAAPGGPGAAGAAGSSPLDLTVASPLSETLTDGLLPLLPFSTATTEISVMLRIPSATTPKHPSRNGEKPRF